MYQLANQPDTHNNNHFIGLIKYQLGDMPVVEESVCGVISS